MHDITIQLSLVYKKKAFLGHHIESVFLEPYCVQASQITAVTIRELFATISSSTIDIDWLRQEKEKIGENSRVSYLFLLATLTSSNQ